ncbi:hypothetical protein NHX12_011973 [Muraenolepis orangiensis]|uniref:Uncharacterized protein n=1 Tax=Muraenolepis orangiensis TaxID=630683 RepID=A0A9Q0DJY5_9TELE|nr:hypothetical protein NHX12_011973 [Muraenolepis orangiensis]
MEEKTAPSPAWRSGHPSQLLITGPPPEPPGAGRFIRLLTLPSLPLDTGQPRLPPIKRHTAWTKAHGSILI